MKTRSRTRPTTVQKDAKDTGIKSGSSLKQKNVQKTQTTARKSTPKKAVSITKKSDDGDNKIKKTQLESKKTKPMNERGAGEKKNSYEAQRRTRSTGLKQTEPTTERNDDKGKKEMNRILIVRLEAIKIPPVDQKGVGKEESNLLLSSQHKNVPETKRRTRSVAQKQSDENKDKNIMNKVANLESKDTPTPTAQKGTRKKKNTIIETQTRTMKQTENEETEEATSAVPNGAKKKKKSSTSTEQSNVSERLTRTRKTTWKHADMKEDENKNEKIKKKAAPISQKVEKNENTNTTSPSPTKQKNIPEIHTRTRRAILKLRESTSETNGDNNKNVKNKAVTPSLESKKVLKLRKRKSFDYAESSLEVTKTRINDSTVKKIPIYRQQLKEPKMSKNQKDLYEFDSDSEKHKKRKRRKLDDDTSLDEYDKTIQNVLKNIANRVKNRSRKVVFADKKSTPKRVQTKKKIKENNNNQTQTVVNRTNLPTVNNVMSPAPGKCSPIDNDVSDCFGFAEAEAPKVAIRNENLTPKHVDKEVKENHNKNKINPAPQNRSDTSDGSDFFGFDEPEASKIKIISDEILTPNRQINLSIMSPQQFERCKPNANSTMLNVLTPWRFNEINIRRNPHFIALKQSSLPSINQDMVLDYSVVEKLGDISRSEAADLPPTPAKKSVQKTLTEYFGANTEANKENADVSIFDVEPWSPVKSPRKATIPVTVKRKVLGEQDSNIVVSPPKRQEANEPSDFGFGSYDDEEEVDSRATKPSKEGRPFRVSVNVNDKKYTKKDSLKKIERAKSVISSDDEDQSDLSDLEAPNGAFKLFEDLPKSKQEIEKENNARNKRTKKLRWMEQSPKLHKKRKDVRTRAEEEEAEKWAASFNSMCEEVDQFPLEIE